MINRPLVTVGVVLFGTKYLEESIPSLLAQDYENIEFLFVDQEEGKWSAFDYLKSNFPEIEEKVRLQKGKNLWHSGGHNKLINQMAGDYYFCLSNDMFYEKDFVTKIVARMEENSEYGFATCKSLRWDYQNHIKTNVIDSFGMGITKWHKFYEIGNGEEDQGQYDWQKDIFGASGAVVIFKRDALEKIKYQNQYFDELLHYKNDCDLSYRLQWAGVNGLFVPEAKVWHDRQFSSAISLSDPMRRKSVLGDKIVIEKNFSDKFPIKVRFLTWGYHVCKRLFLLLKFPGLLADFVAFRKLRSEISSRKNAMPRVVGADQKIIKFMN